MLELVTIEWVREQTHEIADSDGSPSDTWFGMWIPVISQAVALWLKDEWRLYVPLRGSSGEIVRDENGDPLPQTDDSGSPVPQPIVMGAVALEVASQMRYREGEGKDNVVTPDAGYGYVLNKASTALLTPLRRPTVR